MGIPNSRDFDDGDKEYGGQFGMQRGHCGPRWNIG